jgi:hypothetical protein
MEAWSAYALPQGQIVAWMYLGTIINKNHMDLAGTG